MPVKFIKMCISRPTRAILLVLKLSFQNCPTYKRLFGAPPHKGVSGALRYTTAFKVCAEEKH